MTFQSDEQKEQNRKSEEDETLKESIASTKVEEKSTKASSLSFEEDDIIDIMKEENLYEIFYLVGNLDEDACLKIENKLGEVISKYGGRINNFSKMTNIKFSYPIKKNYSGKSQSIRFYCEPSKIEAIRMDLKFLPEILRFFIIKINIQKTGGIKKKSFLRSVVGMFKKGAKNKDKLSESQKKEQIEVSEKEQIKEQIIEKED